jgi:hypothetical protein
MNFSKWKKEFAEQGWHFFAALAFLAIAIVLNYMAGMYVTNSELPVGVPDIILSHLGPYDLSFIFIWGMLLATPLFFIYPLFFRPRQLPYWMCMFSFLVIVRAFFICLTALKTPVDAISLNPPLIFNSLFHINDQFFSGHAAIPFLGFLLADRKSFKYFMLFLSILLGAVALLTHIHYSIDVFAAYFITYGVFKIGEKWFRRMKD